MATLSEIVKRLEKFVADNSPAIMTAIGVTGTLTTAYLTGRASFKAAEIIQREQLKIDLDPEAGTLDKLTTREKVELVWHLYIPAAATGAVTIAAIVFANRIGNRRAAAMAAAYSITEKAFSEYKAKVAEKLGESKEQAIRDELAQDRVNRNPVSSREVIITNGGNVLCMESFTGRYFQSDMETLRKAQNDINHKILHDFYASLTDFYELIGLPRTAVSDDLGWNSDKMLELRFSATLAEGKPCMVIDYSVDPVRDYWRLS